MRAEQFEEIRRSLADTGSYETDARRAVAWFDRLLGWCDAWYYLRVFFEVMAGARVARRGVYTNDTWQRQSFEMLGIAEGCGARIRVSGMADVMRTPGPKVFVSNHMSMLETMLLPGILLVHGDVAFVVKRSLLRYPLFGAILRAVRPVGVTRENAREDLKQVLSDGERFLRAGRSVILFPQRTRSADFVPDQFNTLGLKLARRAEVSIVPVALKTDFVGIGRIWKDIGRLHRGRRVFFRFGEPHAPGDNGRAAHACCVRFIAGCLREWGATVRAGADG